MKHIPITPISPTLPFKLQSFRVLRYAPHHIVLHLTLRRVHTGPMKTAYFLVSKDIVIGTGKYLMRTYSVCNSFYMNCNSLIHYPIKRLSLSHVELDIHICFALVMSRNRSPRVN